jgi:hypothetical protein
MGGRFESKANALGSTNEIVVIADDSVWDGPVGDSLRYFYGSPYPIMPQPEPIFDLRHFTAEELMADDLRRELRTYLIIGDLSQNDSGTNNLIKKDLGEARIQSAMLDEGDFSTVGQDRWARGQVLIYVYGKDDTTLINHLIGGFPSIARRINQHDLKQVSAATYLEGENIPISNLISSKFGAQLKIPGDFKVAMERDNFIWIRKDNREITASFMFTKRPYYSEEQFSKSEILALRDTLGRKYISATAPGSYMRTNFTDLPVYTYEKTIDNKYCIESRGIWEMAKEYMGGPFVNYMILNSDKNEILFIDGFVYAPGKEKRNYIQQLEHIVTSLSIL